MSTETKIECPNCHTQIDVNSILYKQMQTELQAKFNLELERERKNFQKQSEDLKNEKDAFEKKKQKENELFQERLNAKLQEERKSLETFLKNKIEKEKSDEFLLLQKELNEKSEQLKELNKSKAEVEKLKREKDELKSAIEAEAQRVLNETLSIEKDKIKKAEQDKNELVLKELQKQLEDQKKLTEEMIRKQEQGSMQLQGEIQELAIEEWLRSNFPLDTIQEVKKGARGADCRQVVNTKSKEACGCIYYESKRTKDFGKGWIEKFKNDIREHGANIGIFVTDTMPAGMERMGLREGVWICSYEEFKGLCHVIREHIIALDLALSSQENKGDKMVLLYDYLTSNEFKLQVEGIIEGYTQMKIDLETERRSIMGHWKKREKQLQKVLNNTNFMYNSLRGIAGNAIQTIKVLELPEYFEEEESD
ncbi:MAG TPA: DUF2130 domain-containing protein [Hanamia sp.]|nr:DUF2130 domain-containing protein [Hanamia sp.]